MPSPYSHRRNDLCGHDDHRVGCVACQQHYEQNQCADVSHLRCQYAADTYDEQYMSRFEKSKEVVLAICRRISQAKSDEERAGLQDEQEIAQASQDDVMVYLHHVRRILASTQRKVRQICAGKQNLGCILISIPILQFHT
jgi:hypothetical protein